MKQNNYHIGFYILLESIACASKYAGFQKLGNYCKLAKRISSIVIQFFFIKNLQTLLMTMEILTRKYTMYRAISGQIGLILRAFARRMA